MITFVLWILLPIWTRILKINVLIYCMEKKVRFFSSLSIFKLQRPFLLVSSIIIFKDYANTKTGSLTFLFWCIFQNILVVLLEALFFMRHKIFVSEKRKFHVKHYGRDIRHSSNIFLKFFLFPQTKYSK